MQELKRKNRGKKGEPRAMGGIRRKGSRGAMGKRGTDIRRMDIGGGWN